MRKVKNVMPKLIYLVIFCYMVFTIVYSFFGIKSFTDVSIFKEENKSEPLMQDKTKIQIATWCVGNTAGIENAVQMYNKLNQKKVEVSILQIPQYRYSEVLNMLLTSGEGPDVYGISSEWVSTYINRNWAMDISSYVGNDFINSFPAWCREMASINSYGGSFYTIPSSVITSRLIYNKDLFKAAGLDPEKPPKNISELKEYATTISKTFWGRRFGFAVPLAEDWGAFVQSMEVPFSSSGIYFYDFKKGIFNLSVYEPWLNTLKEMRNNGVIYPGDYTLKSDLIRAQFAEGNIGMMFATNYDSVVLQTQFSAKCDWGVAMPPLLDNGKEPKGKGIAIPGTCYMVNAYTKNSVEAISLWRYLYSDDGMLAQYEFGGDIPVKDKLITTAPKIKNMQAFIDFDKDSPYPIVPSGVNEQSRFEAYSKFLNSNNTKNEELISTTLKINEKSRVMLFGKNYFNYSNFDPMEPLKVIKSK